MLKNILKDFKGRVTDMEQLEFILKHFPNAVEGRILTLEIVDYLQGTWKVTPKNTLFGYSTCADEINRDVTQFNSYYGGKDFHLGGLTGYPFRGKTGFSAFSHHAPNDGKESNLIILYGPHVGASLNSELGKVSRIGQTNESAACGAAISFLNKCREANVRGEVYKPILDVLDTEQYNIETKFMPYAEQILNSNAPIKELVEVNYKIIDEDIRKIIEHLTLQFNGSIYLIGGVMINTLPLHPSFFDLRGFERYRGGDVMVLSDLTPNQQYTPETYQH